MLCRCHMRNVSEVSVIKTRVRNLRILRLRTPHPEGPSHAIVAVRHLSPGVMFIFPHKQTERRVLISFQASPVIISPLIY